MADPLLWPFCPQAGHTEALEWQTDVIRCKTAEERHSLRQTPRQELSCAYQLVPNAYGRARELAKRIGRDPCYAPVWSQRTAVGIIAAHTASLPVDTATSSYQSGGYALVWDADDACEAVKVGSVGSGTITLDPWVVGSYTKALVMPARVATFAQDFEADREPQGQTGGKTNCQARFVCEVTEDLSGASGGLTYPSYLGDPVITDPAVLVGGIRDQDGREVETLDSGSGIVYRAPLYGFPTHASTLCWRALDRAGIQALRIWLHTRKGMWKRFWAPTWNRDVTVTADIGSGSDTIEIAAVGFASTYPLPCDLAIVTKAGTLTCVHVTDANPGSAGREVLTIDGAFSGGCPVSNIAGTCRLTLSRFDADRIELIHKSGGGVTVSVPITEVPT